MIIKLDGNNYNQRKVVHLENDVCRTLMGLNHAGNEPKVIQRYGDRDKDCGYSIHNYSNCIPSNPMSDRGQLLMDKKYRIRKLVPCECAKLMGLTKEDDEKMAAVGISNSQRYKCYGNGIVTNCVELLFEHLYKSQYDPDFECYDEKFLREHSKNFTQAVMT